MFKRTIMNKKTGLSAFTNKRILNSEDSSANIKEPNSDVKESSISTRKRGKGDTVSLTVRLSRPDWERVHQLAVSEGVSIQKLAVDGLSKIFQEHGLSKLS